MSNSLVYPDYPYAPPIKGMFYNQSPRDASINGRYSVYIPDNFEPCSSAVMILPTDYTSSKSFLEGTIGQAWITAADEYGFVVVVAEAYEEEMWNIEDAINLRDDEEYLYGVVDTIRQKYSSIPAAFNMDERGLYIVGYERGGIAAHKMAMHWPQLFAGIASVDGNDVTNEIMSAYGDKFSYPFIAGQNSDGRETIGLANKNIALPAWIISSEELTATGENVVEYWVSAANAEVDSPNEYAQTIYKNGTEEIWVTKNADESIYTPEIIYTKFLSKVLRYTNKPGGTFEVQIDFVNQNGTGFLKTETMIDGYLRRWITYVPSTYDENQAYPLIVAMHGGANRAESFAGDSKWHEAAEKYGLIVIFPQAYPCPLPAFGWIPVPVWNQYIVTPGNPPDDVGFIRQIIVKTKEQYNIDSARVYATGHSNGAGMTWRLGLDAPELFAAIAPAGWTISAVPGGQSVPSLENPLPVWLFMGEYDQMGADSFKSGNPNDTCLKYWADRNGFDYTKLTTEYDATGNYYTRKWTNGSDDIPLFKFTTVADCPHIYTPYECELLWEQFFSKIKLSADGKRYYNNQEVVKGTSV